MTKLEIVHSIKVRIINKINPKSTVLFGSVYHTENEDSDIDLLVFGMKKSIYLILNGVLYCEKIVITESP